MSCTRGVKLFTYSQKSKFFTQKDAFENVVCEMAAILSRKRWVNTNLSYRIITVVVISFSDIMVIAMHVVTYLCCAYSNYISLNGAPGMILHVYSDTDTTLQIVFFLNDIDFCC